jgi:hypothetical protein
MPARTAASLVALCLGLAAGPARAEPPANEPGLLPSFSIDAVTRPDGPDCTMHFHKEPVGTQAVDHATLPFPVQIKTTGPAAPTSPVKIQLAQPAAPPGSLEIRVAAPVAKARPMAGQASAPASPRHAAPAKGDGPPIHRVALLQAEPLRPGGVAPRPLPGDQFVETYQPLGPPGSDRLFRLESEKALMERMRQQEFNRTGQRIIFPDETVLSKEPHLGRNFPPMSEVTEPQYVCYRQLLFQDVNSERYGWDLGIIQPVVSSLLFYKDVLLVPYHAFTHPCQCYDCSAGYCLPGDPVPYLCYPPEISLTGALAEGAAVAGVFLTFP